MDFNHLPNSSFNDESWLYNNTSGSELKSGFNNEALQEPVPFEDFKFSFGMNSDFSTVLTDLPDFAPPPPPLADPFLQEPFDFMASAPNTVLDENDQKAFSSFLDAFFMDPDMQFQQNNNSSNQQHNIQDSNSDFFTHFNDSISPQQQQQQNGTEDEEEHRRSSILQSLDEQKMLHQRLNLLASLPVAVSSSKHSTSSSPATADHRRIRSPSVNNTTGSVTSISEDDNNNTTTPQTIYLRQSNSISSPYTNNTITSNHNSKKRSSSTARLYSYDRDSSKTSRGSSHGSSSSTPNTTTKKSRTNKELLTEEEKRANHIASEQKRRSTIRNGFKDLTDLIPTLKNINNSKSTVLFKAVDFIRYLEKRNKGLREKVGSLELRVEVEGRMTKTITNNSTGVYNNKQLFATSLKESTETTATNTLDTVTTKRSIAVGTTKKVLQNTTPLNTLPFSSELPPPTPTTTTTKFNSIRHMTFESGKKSPTSINNNTTAALHINSQNHQAINNSNMTNSKNNKSLSSPIYSLSHISKSTITSLHHQQKRRRSSSGSGSSSNMSSSSNNHLQGLPANARNALLAHKTQQKQLLILQEQLQMHQKLIAQQQEMKERSLSSANSSAKNKLPPILGQYDSSGSSHHNGKSSLLKELEDKAISAP